MRLSDFLNSLDDEQFNHFSLVFHNLNNDPHIFDTLDDIANAIQIEKLKRTLKDVKL